MKKPRLLDLFSGAGGITKGYMDAGFYVVGVDCNPQPNYCGDEFYQTDALTFPLDGFDFYHASPECDGFSLATLFHGHATRETHLRLIAPIRERFRATGKPYVIENVEHAGTYMVNPIKLCGAMFGLRVYRHRLFESNVILHAPRHPHHTVKAAGPGAIAKEDEFWCVGGHFGQKDEAQRAMGIDWMKTQAEIGNAIPPAYSEYIGRQLLARSPLYQGELFGEEVSA